MVPVAQDAAARAREEGYSVSVLDLRWLAPMDMPNLLASVRAANGKAIILHEANITGGFGAEESYAAASIADALDDACCCC